MAKIESPREDIPCPECGRVYLWRRRVGAGVGAGPMPESTAYYRTEQYADRASAEWSLEHDGRQLKVSGREPTTPMLGFGPWGDRGKPRRALPEGAERGTAMFLLGSVRFAYVCPGERCAFKGFGTVEGGIAAT